MLQLCNLSSVVTREKQVINIEHKYNDGGNSVRVINNRINSYTAEAFGTKKRINLGVLGTRRLI